MGGRQKSLGQLEEGIFVLLFSTSVLYNTEFMTNSHFTARTNSELFWTGNKEHYCNQELQ